VGGAMRPNAPLALRWAIREPMSRFLGPPYSASIASVDAAGMIIGLRPGKAMIHCGPVSELARNGVEVTANPVKSLSVEPRSTNARTGDVVVFLSTNATDAAGKSISSCEVRWAVGGEGAMIEPDGAFVAEPPGAYVISASVGDRPGAGFSDRDTSKRRARIGSGWAMR